MITSEHGFFVRFVLVWWVRIRVSRRSENGEFKEDSGKKFFFSLENQIFQFFLRKNYVYSCKILKIKKKNRKLRKITKILIFFKLAVFFLKFFRIFFTSSFRVKIYQNLGKITKKNRNSVNFLYFCNFSFFFSISFFPHFPDILLTLSSKSAQRLDPKTLSSHAPPTTSLTAHWTQTRGKWSKFWKLFQYSLSESDELITYECPKVGSNNHMRIT